MNRYNKQMIAAATTMNTTINSTAMQTVDLYGYAIQAVWTGTPTGTFKLQASNDPVTTQWPTAQTQPTNWTDITNSSQAVSAAGNFMWNATDVMYNWVRVVYTDGSSGASTASLTTLTFNGKGI